MRAGGGREVRDDEADALALRADGEEAESRDVCWFGGRSKFRQRAEQAIGLTFRL
jgi:hypothetical protein